MQESHVFQSFFMAGFECSTHRRRGGRRLDLLAATAHDRFAASDYTVARQCGLSTVRDGLRWHLIEQQPGRYDWSSFLAMVRAANRARVQVIWDLCHYGWPDDIDIWSSSFVERFAAFCAAAARLVREESDAVPVYCTVNEISFWAWAGGDRARMGPFTRKRGGELKRQLVRAAIAGVDAIRSVDPRARFLWAEPAIQVSTPSTRAAVRNLAESYRLSQYEALDMLCGRRDPDLGGDPRYIDIVGLNFYPDNQWFLGGRTIPLGHFAYRPFRDMIGECHARYGRPIIVSETGAEGSARPSWLHYVFGEVLASRAGGVPVDGLCLYPFIDYPGWENDRMCQVGLLGAADERGIRPVYQPLRDELLRLSSRLDAFARNSFPQLVRAHE